MAKIKKTELHFRQLLEVSVALEIAKSQRDALKEQVEFLKEQLGQTAARADAAEERLHQTNCLLLELTQTAVTSRAQSTATEVMVDGKSILRLSNPSYIPPRSTKSTL